MQKYLYTCHLCNVNFASKKMSEVRAACGQ